VSEKDYFTVETTSLTLPKRGALAIFCGDKPKKGPNGGTSCSLRGPLLLMPPEMWDDPEETLAKVAKVLNDNAHLFFDSAKTMRDGQAATIQAARIEGARLALEAAHSSVKTLIGADLSGSDCRDAGEGYDYAIDDAMEQIRALDPAQIVGGAPLPAQIAPGDQAQARTFDGGTDG
jgi:hypothetical protein